MSRKSGLTVTGDVGDVLEGAGLLGTEEERAPLQQRGT